MRTRESCSSSRSRLLLKWHEGPFSRSNFNERKVLFWCLGKWWPRIGPRNYKKNEKDTHDSREEARRTEEAAERERRIDIVFWILTSVLALWLRTNSLSITSELLPLPEPYNPLVDPEMKEALDVMSLANSIIDEVVDKFLHEATEKILGEE